MTAKSNSAKRIPALDFTKGALVLIMVLYHWLNYFYSTQGFFYRYLRFLTPSFIFITGFLVSNVYFSKNQPADPRLPGRLMQRGLKLLAIFAALNVATGFIAARADSGRQVFRFLSLNTLKDIYLVGNIVGEDGRVVAFFILVPISYLLILMSCLLFAGRSNRYVLYAASILFVVAGLIANFVGYPSGNLELVSMGMLGVLLGYVPIEKINVLLRPAIVLAALTAYVVALTFWSAVYPLQLIGVCIVLAVLYLLGTGDESGTVLGNIILLGKYSLFGYIAQVAILQVLRRGLPRFAPQGATILVISFLAAFVLTVVSVMVMDQARKRAPGVNKLYAAVFS